MLLFTTDIRGNEKFENLDEMCCRNENTAFPINFCNKYKYNTEIKELNNSSAYNLVTSLNNFYHLMIMTYVNIMMQVFYESLLNTIKHMARLQLNYFDRICTTTQNVQDTMVPLGLDNLKYFDNKTSILSFPPQSLKLFKQVDEPKFYTKANKKEKLNKLKCESFENHKTSTKSYLNSKNFEKKENRMLPKNNKIIPSYYFAETKCLNNLNRSCYTNRPEKEIFKKCVTKTADKTENFRNTSKLATKKISSNQAEVILSSIKKLVQGKNAENMSFECPVCHKHIKRLYHFHRHIKIHTGNKEHKCQFCSYSSVRGDNLKSHMKTHERR